MVNVHRDVVVVIVDTLDFADVALGVVCDEKLKVLISLMQTLVWWSGVGGIHMHTLIHTHTYTRWIHMQKDSYFWEPQCTLPLLEMIGVMVC